MKRGFLALIFMLAIFSFGTLSARDIISSLMKESVATLSDAADLIYYSFKSIGSPSKQKDPVVSEINESPENITKFLQEKGIDLPSDNQPITRQELAKILIKRFNLKTSLKTDIFGAAGDYFRDAVRLGIFTDNGTGNESLSTRELLNAFLRADSLGRKK